MEAKSPAQEVFGGTGDCVVWIFKIYFIISVFEVKK